MQNVRPAPSQTAKNPVKESTLNSFLIQIEALDFGGLRLRKQTAPFQLQYQSSFLPIPIIFFEKQNESLYHSMLKQ